MLAAVQPDARLQTILGRPSYVLQDYSFDFVYADQPIWCGRAWLCFGRIEVAIHLLDGQFLGCSGLTNYQMWNRVSLQVPEASEDCGLVMPEFRHLHYGVGYTIAKSQFEDRYYDEHSGWFCTGNPSMAADRVVQFATGCLACVTHDQVTAIWIHPCNWQAVNAVLA